MLIRARAVAAHEVGGVGRPRCWSARQGVARRARRVGQAEVLVAARVVAPREWRRRAGRGVGRRAGCWQRASGGIGQAAVLVAARAVAPRERAAAKVPVAAQAVAPRERELLVAALGFVYSKRSALSNRSRRSCCPARTSGRRTCSPRCRGLLPCASCCCRAGRGVGRRASCCLAHARDTCFQPAASSFRPAARSFRLASSLLHRPIARGDSPRARLHSRQRAARPVPLST